jgi:hypothetical protein
VKLDKKTRARQETQRVKLLKKREGYLLYLARNLHKVDLALKRISCKRDSRMLEMYKSRPNVEAVWTEGEKKSLQKYRSKCEKAGRRIRKCAVKRSEYRAKMAREREADDAALKARDVGLEARKRLAGLPSFFAPPPSLLKDSRIVVPPEDYSPGSQWVQAPPKNASTPGRHKNYGSSRGKKPRRRKNEWTAST